MIEKLIDREARGNFVSLSGSDSVDIADEISAILTVLTVSIVVPEFNEWGDEEAPA